MIISHPVRSTCHRAITIAAPLFKSNSLFSVGRGIFEASTGLIVYRLGSYNRRIMSSKRELEEKVEEASSPVAGEKAAVEKKKSAKKPKVAAAPPGPVYDPATMRKEEVQGDGVMKILSWNVAGLRAFLKKAQTELDEIVRKEKPDILCLQEHKLQQGKNCDDAEEALKEHFPNWNIYWNCSIARKGYSGTAVLSKKEPLSVTYGIGIDSHDDEGRVITAEFDSLYVVNVYVPNSGEGLKRLDYRVGKWDKALSEYVKGLESKGKPVVLTGDMNCAAEEIDIHSPKTNLRSAGFTIEERESFAENYLNSGFTDVFRKLHPGVVGYTYWGYRFNLRAKNKGWRLDYFLVSDELDGKIHDCYHLSHIMGSDHCPLGLTLRLKQ